ncbi:ORF2 [torque teno Delphinidae virus 55]
MIRTVFETQWLTTLHVTHSMGCNCGDPIGHLLQCVRTHIEEDDGFEDALVAFELDDAFIDDTAGTGPGTAAASG